jgi:antitoxin component of MazEF toxin-antitoxin module
VGNSAGFVIPAILLKEVNVEIGTVIDLTVRDGYFVATPIRSRVGPRSTLTLSRLIANYVRHDDELFTNPTGNEVIKDGNDNEQPTRRGST